MSTTYTINFRREAFQRERAKMRRRATLLGVWLAYFGALAVILGLYGLNCVVLARRTAMIERQVARLRAAPHSTRDWRPTIADAREVDNRITDTRAWADRLQRLPRILPTQARLTSIQFNPDQVSGDARKLILAGEYRIPAGHDRTTSVMAFVEALARDSVFAASYHNVRLVSTRVAASGDGAEFVIECR